MASSLAETLKADFLNCAVCVETYRDPRALPCQHGFCRDCLEQLVASSKDKNTLGCPTCREEVKLSRAEVKNLPVHFLVSSLKDTVDMEQKMRTPTCTNCSTPSNKAMVRCVDCQDYLCDVCLDFHKKFKAFKDHKVVTMEDISAGKVDFKKEEENRYCKAHGKLCEYYCETEKKVLCRDCVILNFCPAYHTRVSLKKAAENLADDLKELKSKCDDALERCQEAVTTTKGVRAELILNHQEAIDSLSTVETQYVDLIRKRVKALKGIVDQMKEEREEKIDQKQVSLEQIVRDIEKTSEDVSRVLTSESEFEILATHSTLSSQFKQLLNCETEAAKSSLGCIKFKTATPVVAPIGQLSSNEEWAEIGQFSTGNLNNLHGIDIGQDGNVVVCGWKKGVKVFSAEGQIQCTLYDEPGAIDVAVTQDQKYVSGPGGKQQISTHDCTGQEISMFSVTNVDNERSNVNSVAVDPSGRIIAAQVKNTISIHDTDGSVISKFAMESMPFRLSATSNGTIVTSIVTDKSLQMMDYSGGNIRIIQPPPEVKVWAPSFVCCSQNEVFVCNRDTGDPSGVYRFTSEGDYLGCVTTNVVTPRGIALSKCGMKLFVADETDGCVKIFQRP